METLKQYNAARRVSVPLIIWKTPDAAATINEVRDGAKYPILSWDIVRGLVACNDEAKGKADAECGVGNPVDMLVAAQNLPADSVVFMHNSHLFITDSAVKQAVWNLRDTNKGEHRTLVMLAPQMITPVELANDVLVIDEQLPGESELQAIVESQAAQAIIGATESKVEFKALTKRDTEQAVDALAGLSAFAAEQTVAVSFEKNGNGVSLNLATCWDRKRQAIEETRGLKVWRGGDTLDAVQGCSNVKDFAHKVINGRRPPRVIVWIDEMEKSGVGNQGDLSGTNSDQTAVLLKDMQDNEAQGMLYVGHPGSAKSMVAKAIGATAGIPTIQLDLGAMKDSLVGNSEANIRAAMKVINAVSQGRALYIATCNKIDVLPPELKRRFTLGTFFFDLPTQEERDSIWAYYLKKYGLDKGLKGKDAFRPIDSNGWTGADIANCCNRAWLFDCSIEAAAKYATPVCKTNPQGIEALRRLADNAFISANYEGLYQINKQTVALDEKKARKMSFK